MKSSDVHYMVKILSGVNEGAQVSLPRNIPIVIGHSNDCDVILNGAAVADKHIKITLLGQSIKLIPLAQPVYVNGKDVGLREYNLELYHVVEVGGVCFTIGLHGRPWPAYDPEQRSMRSMQHSLPNYVINEHNSIFRSPWLWSAVAILLLVNIHYFSRQIGGIPGILGLKPNVEESISALTSEKHFKHVKINQGSNGLLMVSGYVASSDERKQVKQDIAELSENTNVTLFIDKELEVSARTIAQSLNERRVMFSTLEHGRLKASGLVKNRQSWQNVKENIRDDVKGVESLNDQEVIILSEKLTRLEQKIALEDFHKRLSVKLVREVVEVRGELTKAEKLRWQHVKRSFAKEVYPFTYRELLQKPDHKIKLALRSVSVGDVPFVVSKEGEKYFKGSHVGQGYYIKAINDSNIILKNDDIEFPIFFGQKE
jgi:type III secretion system YscD/HrpQ family protein